MGGNKINCESSWSAKSSESVLFSSSRLFRSLVWKVSRCLRRIAVRKGEKGSLLMLGSRTRRKQTKLPRSLSTMDPECARLVSPETTPRER